MSKEDYLEAVKRAIYEACQPFVLAGNPEVPAWSEHQNRIWETIAEAAISIPRPTPSNADATSRVLTFDQVVPSSNADVASLVERGRETAHAISQYEPEDGDTGKLLCDLADALEACQAELAEVRERTLEEAAEVVEGKCHSRPEEAGQVQWNHALESAASAIRARKALGE